MTGISILYSQLTEKEKSEQAIGERDLVKRMRETYWARCALSLLCKGSGLASHMFFNQKTLGKDINSPGDSFAFVALGADTDEIPFRWIEVTEVYTTVNPRDIVDVMKHINGISRKRTVSLEQFIESLDRGIPSMQDQKKAGDNVLASIKKKIDKSYSEVVTAYGYGTLVIGMPLWFAVPPLSPSSPDNGTNDFWNRTQSGLRKIEKEEMSKEACPFNRIIVLWAQSPEAIEEWEALRSDEYDTSAYRSLSVGCEISRLFGEALKRSGTPDIEMSSSNFYLQAIVDKFKVGIGPYPPLVTEWMRARKNVDY